MLKKLFGRKKEVRNWDREHCRPVIRKSICTGEEVAGFENLRSHDFTEVMLISGPDDLKEFMELYGLEEKPYVIF